MSKWLHCTITSGMFSDEFTVVVRTRSGQNVSVFVPRDDAVADQSGNGRVKVRVVEQAGRAIAVLPNEYQTVVDVNASDIIPA